MFVCDLSIKTHVCTFHILRIKHAYAVCKTKDFFFFFFFFFIHLFILFFFFSQIFGYITKTWPCKAKKKNKNVSQAPPHLSETPRITPFYRLKKKKINKIAHLLQIFVFVSGDQEIKPSACKEAWKASS